MRQPSQVTIQTTRPLIHDPRFCQRHRTSAAGFTRRRRLNFMSVLTLLLQKTVRSMQAHWHDFLAALPSDCPTVTPASWCEARLKLRHPAFSELNERAILAVGYGGQRDFAVRRWQTHRWLGIDSALIRLPKRAALGKEFGWAQCANPAGSSGRSPQGRLSGLTEGLNRIVIQTFLRPWQQGERDWAREHIERMAPEALALRARGCAAAELCARFVGRPRWFVCRCPTSRFGIGHQLFQADPAGRSVIVPLRPSSHAQAQVRPAGLPQDIPVRFVTGRLETGQLAVLATHLLDEARHPTGEFKALYNYRWGIETFSAQIKGRLDLENFTGGSAEAVRQDLQATIFLRNLETILIQPAQEPLQAPARGRAQRQQVNHAVSFHAIKSRRITLLLRSEPISEVRLRLERWFLSHPVRPRPERRIARRKQSGWRSYQFQRNPSKVVF